MTSERSRTLLPAAPSKNRSRAGRGSGVTHWKAVVQVALLAC